VDPELEAWIDLDLKKIEEGLTRPNSVCPRPEGKNFWKKNCSRQSRFDPFKSFF
jgi:hypothetical protein